MKKMKILLVAFITIFCLNNAHAQSHIVNANYGCRLKPGSLNTEKDLCPACAANDKNEQDAKIAEEKLRFAEAQAAAKAKKEATEKERLEKIEADKKNAESGKVYINGNNNINYNNSTEKSSFQQGLERGQQITEIATGLTELFTPSPEQIKRREQAAAEYARQKKIKDDLAFQQREIEDGNRFDLLYLPLMDKAIKGDENARMILCFSSLRLLSTQKVPKWDTWMDEAYANNNTDAILEKSQVIEQKVGYGHYVVTEAIPYYEKAANLGSIDAMLILAEWYNLKKEFAIHGAGENAELALKYFKKAAELGSPNAMFHLGMIYKYGRAIKIDDVSGSSSNSEFKKKYVTYEILIDEKKAFEYFFQSEQPDYLRSIFHKGRWKSAWRVCDGSYFNKGTYRELALIYNEGKFVTKDKFKAKEYKVKYENYKPENNF